MTIGQPEQLPAPPTPPTTGGAGGFLRRHRTAAIVVGVCAVVGIIAVSSALSSNDKPSEPSRPMSLTEAVCKMLNDGDTPDFAVRVARDLAADHPATFDDPAEAARLALAQAQG